MLPWFHVLAQGLLAAALVVSVTNSISFVKELLESAGDVPPSHEILVECEVVLTKCLADLAHISSDGEWRAWTWRESRGGSIMYLCLFVTSSSGMYWYSMEGEVGIYSMFFYIKK